MSEMTMTDCFAYRPTRCSALDKRYCDTGVCGFFKTEKEFKAAAKAAEKGNPSVIPCGMPPPFNKGGRTAGGEKK